MLRTSSCLANGRLPEPKRETSLALRGSDAGRNAATASVTTPVNLSGPRSKLEEARGHLRLLERAHDTQEFTASFVGAVTALRSTWDAVKFVVKPHGGKRWLDDVWNNELLVDPLLSWIHEARIGSFHHARQLLQVQRLEISNLTVGGSGDVLIYPDGAYQIVDRGTPHERREPYPAAAKVDIVLRDPPMAHLGREISDPSPQVVLGLALTWFEKLVYRCLEQPWLKA